MSEKAEYLFEKEEFIETMNVGELIKILEKYPKHMKVMTTWESTVNGCLEENIYEAITGTLYIDADYNFYKESFKK